MAHRLLPHYAILNVLFTLLLARRLIFYTKAVVKLDAGPHFNKRKRTKRTTNILSLPSILQIHGQKPPLNCISPTGWRRATLIYPSLFHEQYGGVSWWTSNDQCGTKKSNFPRSDACMNIIHWSGYSQLRWIACLVMAKKLNLTQPIS